MRRGGGRVRQRATKAAVAVCGSCHLNFQGACTMRANRYWRRGRQTRSGGTPSGLFARDFVSGHIFYVCNFRTKHKMCILAYIIIYDFVSLCFYVSHKSNIGGAVISVTGCGIFMTGDFLVSLSFLVHKFMQLESILLPHSLHNRTEQKRSCSHVH